MPTDRVTFPSAFGDELAARLERPDGAPEAFALFAHCFTCSKDLRAAREITRALAARGLAVLRFDFTGLGESEGDFADTSFSSNVDDLVAAADWLRAEHAAPALLLGHSLGGAAVVAAAAEIDEVRALATIGAPSEGAHLRETILRQAPELEGTDEAEVEIGGRPFRIRRELLDDLERVDVGRRLAELAKPVVVFHAPADEVVPIEHAERIFDAASHPKSFVALDGADHLLSDPADGRFVAAVLAAWAARYVGDAGGEDARLAPGRPLGRGEVLVVGGPEGYATPIHAGGHRLQADEPVDAGGTDTGPTPYDLLLAALGSCKAITLRMYADRKGWPLRGVRVRLRHDRIHAEDCAECETETGRVDRIETELELVGSLSDGQRARLLEIADRCPVHRTLTSETVIRTAPPEPAGGPAPS